MDKKSILVFGVGSLQKSIIERCKLKRFFIVGIDPSDNASCRNEVDAFEVIDGQNFDKTIQIAEKFNVNGIITAATDKPLVMMARVAEKLNLPFFSIATANYSTDKYLMKQKLQRADIPCAKGFLLNMTDDLEKLSLDYPVIIKPRDNSGSRGVLYCKNFNEVKYAVKEAHHFTRKSNLLVEEYIHGKEYSVESIHFNGKSHIIQITEKITSDFPYNVELGHIQPANINIEQWKEICTLIENISIALDFENCPSHTEIKINSNGVYVIETSPRLGGDFISSTLVPLSTGINMEDVLIDISVKSKKMVNLTQVFHRYSGVLFFQLPKGIVRSTGSFEEVRNIKGFQSYRFDLKPGQKIPFFKNSIDRYGYSIFCRDKREELYESIELCKDLLYQEISIDPLDQYYENE